MNAPSEDIKDMLEAESSLELTFANNLFIGKEPETPDNCVTIFDTAVGLAPQLTLSGEQDYYYQSIQVRVRNNDYMTAWDLIQDITTALHGRAQEVWNGTLYTVIFCSSGPAQLDWDENNRARFIVNFNIQRR